MTRLLATTCTLLAAFTLSLPAQEAPKPYPWEAALAKKPLEAAEHGPLLERQAKLPAELSREAVSLSIQVLAPDFYGLVTSTRAKYDFMDGPSEVIVEVSEGGILDDDLIAIRHEVTLDRNSNGEWRVTGYRRCELRRADLK